MRSRWPSKQRLWLGTGRHLCCGGRRYTDADAHCYSNSDRDVNGQPYCYSDSDRHSNGQRHCYSDSDCHANGQRHCYSDSDRDANCQPYGYAATDANTQSWAISKATPHASAQAIEFPYWKFLVLGHRCSSSVEEIADRMLHAPSFLDGLSRLVHVNRGIAEQKRVRG